MHSLGFADDPFLDFYPPEYHFHFTGRSRAPQSELRTVLPGIESLTAQVIQEARDSGVKLYAEIELVRDIQHFASENTARDLSALENVTFNLSPEPLQIKADIHVEFRAAPCPTMSAICS